jgi:hypothetical protein
VADLYGTDMSQCLECLRLDCWMDPKPQLLLCFVGLSCRLLTPHELRRPNTSERILRWLIQHDIAYDTATGIACIAHADAARINQRIKQLADTVNTCLESQATIINQSSVQVIHCVTHTHTHTHTLSLSLSLSLSLWLLDHKHATINILGVGCTA